MGFGKIKTWDDKKTCDRRQCTKGRTWVRRIQWLEDPEGRIKLKLEDGNAYKEVIPMWTAAAQTVWDRFKAGQSIDDSVSILASDAPPHLSSRRTNN